jgi:hypothetical protein
MIAGAMAGPSRAKLPIQPTPPARRPFGGHLERIAGMFAQGNFSLPMFIHDAVPPGVAVMQHLKGQITYTAENTAQGAQVRIATSNPEALTAIHEFLRFQIRDHRTSDPLTVQPSP